MNLRPELLPPPRDEALFERLLTLARDITEPPFTYRAEQLAEFNRLANTDLCVEDFPEDYTDPVSIEGLMIPHGVLVRDLSDSEILELTRLADELILWDPIQSHLTWQALWFGAILRRSFLGPDTTPNGLKAHHEKRERILAWEQETGTTWGVDF